MLLWNKRTFSWLTSSMLLSLERANAEALLFTRLIATFLESFYFFFNCIARYAQSKESRNLLKKIPQSSCKAILRSCLFYEAEFGESSASPKPIINLSSYIVSYLSKANIKDVTKSSYHLMMRHLRFFHTLSSIASW